MTDDRFKAAIEKIDQANSEDPNKETFEGKEYPKELLYSIRMTGWLEKVAPNASEALKIATRSQHIQRWKIPRKDYPMDRVGYFKWRDTLKVFHAELVSGLLKEAGYDEETIGQVASLLKKEKLKTNPETQTLEDVICLVFLENYFSDFAGKHDEEMVIDIIQKSWKKMSEAGHKVALQLSLDKEASHLVEKALEK